MPLNSIKKLTITLAILSLFSQTAFAAQAEEAPPTIDLDFGPPKLEINVPKEDSDKPPGLTINVPKDFEDSSKGIKITDDDAEPDNFNPAISHTKITFTVSAKALIEIRIQKNNGENIVKLIENEEITKDEHFVNWYGTEDNIRTGKVVPNGTYKYKIIARNLKTKDIEDTAEGDIGVKYFVSPFSTDGGVLNSQPDQIKATVIMQNEFNGDTSQTGPSMIVYFAFPLAYFLIRRKFLKY